MEKIKSSVSCEDLKKVLDSEKMFDVSINGISVPYTCNVDSSIKIGDLSKELLGKRRKELRRTGKCYIRYNPLDNVFRLYHIIGFNKYHSEEIYADVIEVASDYCGYYDSIDITKNSLYSDVYCEYYEVTVEFYNEVKRMINVCNEEIKSIARTNSNKSNLYDWDELNKYGHAYKVFCNDGKHRHYCSNTLAEMSISEFNNKLAVHNELVDDTLDKMFYDLTNEFIGKHRYILCNEGTHCYSVRRFDSFCIGEDHDNKEDRGYIKRYIMGNGERIHFVAPSVYSSINCRVNYSKFSLRFSSLNIYGLNRIYHLSDDNLGDKLFEDYKLIYNKVGENYDKITFGELFDRHNRG